MNDNILYIDRVRRKNKSFWHYLLFSWYYEDENIPFKEKVYTFYYNMERTGLTTNGEMDWSFRMMNLDYEGWQSIHNEFKNDYKEFIKSARLN